MGERENNKYDAQQYIELAQQTLNEYQVLRDQDLNRGGMSRLYFAAYQAVYALLISLGESPKTHKGVADRFYQHFVSTGKIPKEINAGYSKLIMYRGWSDYEFGRSINDTDLDMGYEVTTYLIEFAKNWISTME